MKRKFLNWIDWWVVTLSFVGFLLLESLLIYTLYLCLGILEKRSVPLPPPTLLPNHASQRTSPSLSQID
ncbi:MAG: hypothetical protein HYY23_10450 [Verrucomicrobia bacterium]|nr:hypothetical protein [Verrucomicrobiota bacterium]